MVVREGYFALFQFAFNESGGVFFPFGKWSILSAHSILTKVAM